MFNKYLILSAAMLCAACAVPSATPSVLGKWRCEHPRFTQTLHFGADHSLVRTLTLHQPKSGMRFRGTWQWQNGICTRTTSRFCHARRIYPCPKKLRLGCLCVTVCVRLKQIPCCCKPKMIRKSYIAVKYRQDIKATRPTFTA